MSLNLDSYKGKTLDDETLSALIADVNAYTEPLEARIQRVESNARKRESELVSKLKAEADKATKALEKLGIETPEELDSLPDAKGQAEALKQYEIKLKRAERAEAEIRKAHDELSTRYGAERRERAIAEQVSKHPFIDAEDARALVSARLHAEGDELLFTQSDGLRVPLADGVAWIAKTKPHLVRPAGDGAAGSGFKGSKPGAGTKTIKQADFEAMAPKDRAKAIADGYTLSET